MKSLSVNAGLSSLVQEPQRPAGEGQGHKVSRESQEVEQALAQVSQEAEEVKKQVCVRLPACLSQRMS